MPGRARPACCAIGGFASGLALLLGGLGHGAPSAVPAVAAEQPPALSSLVIAEVGPGYAVSSQGPLVASQFASGFPDPAAASSALTALAKTVGTYARAWHTANGLDQVQDLLVRFPSATGAMAFERAARQSLELGEIVQRGPLPSVPGAERVTYFPTADRNRRGRGNHDAQRRLRGAADLLLGRKRETPGPFRRPTPRRWRWRSTGSWRRRRVGRRSGPGGSTAAPTKKSGTSSSAIGWAVLAVAVLMVAVATPLLLRRRRDRAAAQDAVPNG